MSLRAVLARRPEHFLAIEALQLEILPEDRPHPTDAGAWWVVVDDAATPVAFAGIVPSSRWSDCLYLCRAGVTEDYRGMGLQKRLITVRERYARTAQMNWLVTDTTDNPASANSLIARGFRLFDPSRPWGPRGALYWRKRIGYYLTC